MKKLQHNFTTPEQSKRLLELGVPADSADLYYSEGVDIKYGEVIFEYNTEPEILPKSAITGETILFSEYKNKYTGGYVLPCWSVARLIEILSICGSMVRVKRFKIEEVARFYKSQKSSVVDLTIEDIETLIESGDIDFSNLEE